MIYPILYEQLNLKFPIIQAPMAGGITSPQLVEASASHGVMGMFGAGYMTVDALTESLQSVDAQYIKKIGVNLFIPQKYEVENRAVEKMKSILQPYYDHFKIDASKIELGSPEQDQAQFEAQLKLILQEGVRIVSFTFGAPDTSVVNLLHEMDCFVMATATHMVEARTLAAQNVDAIVLQGQEAGGHQATFLKKNSNFSLETFVKEAVAELSVPVIASGGIMSGKQAQNYLDLGASLVQMGSAFLLTDESGAHPLHQSAILQTTMDKTVLTRAFSGRLARGVYNQFIADMSTYEADFLPYPLLNRLTQPIRKAAKQALEQAYLSLWSGVNGYQGEQQSVASLIEKISQDLKV